MPLAASLIRDSLSLGGSKRASKERAALPGARMAPVLFALSPQSTAANRVTSSPPKQCSLTESAVRTPQITVGKSSYNGAKRFASLTFKKLFSPSTKSHRLQCYKPRDEEGDC